MENKYRIPEKVYVKFDRRSRGDEDYILGFMTPYDPDDKKFKDRKMTVDRWSERGGNESIVDKQAWLGYNEPMNGFEILHTVSRWRTSNKVWRVLDPRGFELEISSWNLSDLLQEATLEQGVIQEDCVWARDSNGDNQLIPTTSKAYKEAQLYTEVRNNRVSLRDVKRGDIVMLHDGRKVEYLGGMYYLAFTAYERRKGSANFNREYFFIVHEDDGTKRLDQKSGVKVGLVVEEIDEELTKAEAAAKVHERLQDYNRYYMMARTDKFEKADIEVSLRDYELPETLETKGRNLIRTPLLLGEYEGQQLFWKSHQNWRMEGEDYEHSVADADYLFKEGRFHLKRYFAEQERYGSTVEREVRVPMTLEDMRAADWKQVIFTIDGVEYTPWTPF